MIAVYSKRHSRFQQTALNFDAKNRQPNFMDIYFKTDIFIISFIISHYYLSPQKLYKNRANPPKNDPYLEKKIPTIVAAQNRNILYGCNKKQKLPKCMCTKKNTFY